MSGKRGRGWTPADTAQLRRLAGTYGSTVASIAATMDFSEDTIYVWLRKERVKIVREAVLRPAHAAPDGALLDRIITEARRGVAEARAEIEATWGRADFERIRAIRRART